MARGGAGHGRAQLPDRSRPPRHPGEGAETPPASAAPGPFRRNPPRPLIRFQVRLQPLVPHVSPAPLEPRSRRRAAERGCVRPGRGEGPGPGPGPGGRPLPQLRVLRGGSRAAGADAGGGGPGLPGAGAAARRSESTCARAPPSASASSPLRQPWHSVRLASRL